KHLHDFCVFNFFAACIEARSAESDVECLPLARRLAGVHAWRMAFYILFIDPPAINTAAFDSRVFVLLDTVAVVDLNFIAPHQINSGVGMFGNPKFNMRLHVAKFRLTNEVDRMSLFPIEQYAFTPS